MECKTYLITFFDGVIVTVIEYSGGDILANPANYETMTKAEALEHFQGYEGYEQLEELPDCDSLRG